MFIQCIEDYEMLAINNLNIRNLQSLNLEAVNDSKQWLTIKNVTNDEKLKNEYADIYKNHAVKSKWVLMINPENEILESIDDEVKKSFSKILRVNSNKVNVKLENIESTLRKGNCSVVIINKSLFNNDELARLYTSAKKGNTQCIILNNKERLH